MIASSAKGVQIRELKGMISQPKTKASKQTGPINFFVLIDEKFCYVRVLQEQVDYLAQKLFGSFREREVNDIPGQQNFFSEAEVELTPALLEEETAFREAYSQGEGAHKVLVKGLKLEKVVYSFPEEIQSCPISTQMVSNGEEYVRRELEFIPTICKVSEYYS